ncbi:hypothetical protein HDU67_005798, partial [Dinochytrium kinnereticum]
MATNGTMQDKDTFIDDASVDGFYDAVEDGQSKLPKESPIIPVEDIKALPDVPPTVSFAEGSPEAAAAQKVMAMKTMPFSVKPKLQREETSSSITTVGGSSIKMKSAGKAVLAAQTMKARNTKKSINGMSAAQAMSRLTGTIFDSDAQVPVFLRTPVVAVVGASDTVRKSVATYKPMVEALMYWETFTSSIYITFGLFWAYVLG